MKLTTKIISVISIVLFVCLIVFTYIFININSQKLKQEIDKDSNTISMFISSFSMESLLIEDYPTVQTHIDNLYQKFENILCIEIIHNDLVVIGNNCEKFENVDFKKYSSSIENIDIGTIGYVNLYLKDDIKSIIKSRVINILIFFAILYVLLLLSMSAIIKKLLLDRIEKISNFSKELANGNYHDNLTFNQKDELTTLANDLKKMSNTIRSKQKSLNEAQELAKIGTWMINYVSGEIYWNDETYNICNFDKNVPLKFQTLFNLIHPDDQFLFRQAENEINSKNTYEEEFRIVVDNKIKYVYLKWTNVLNSNAGKLSTTGIIQDITEKELIKKQQKEHEAMLIHQQRLVHKAEILEMVGHHWRQPLNQIALASQMVEFTDEEHLSDDAKKNLNDIKNITNELSNTINDFKSFFNDQKVIKKVKLDSLIDDTVRLVTQQLQDNHIALNKNYDTNYFYDVTISVSDFSQVLLAILINAIEILENKNTQKAIEISLTQNEKQEVVITIKDNGGGIDKNYFPFIFDPYFSTKREKNGTGLGLFMAKNIVVNILKGDIEASSDSIGAEFTITIPRNN